MPVPTAAVILAAGAGTRFRSTLPKPLHRIAGQPMIDYAINAVETAAPRQLIVVLSPELNASDDIMAHLQIRLGERLGIAVQHEPRGTGHALQCAVGLIHDDVEQVVVVFADHPLLEPASVQRLLESLDQANTSLSLLTCPLDGGGAYGRIERDQSGAIQRIVERKDDRPDARVGAVEVNTGMMAIRRDWLGTAIDRLVPSAATGEYYLTQLAELAVADGRRINNATGSDLDLTGVNDRVELAAAEAIVQEQLRSAFQRAGVTFINGQTTTIEQGVELAQDVVIEPGCVLRSGTVVGARSVVGPNSVLSGARIGADCRVISSYVTDSDLADCSDVGPFSHIRGGSYIATGVHIGNFAEVKNSTLEPDVRMGHFSYIGDARVGARVNIGAGVVTCNFDGTAKHKTVIGEDAFVGSDSMLVAPVRIGDGAVTGAGSVVTRDVADGDRVAGVPAKPIQSRRERRGNG